MWIIWKRLEKLDKNVSVLNDDEALTQLQVSKNKQKRVWRYSGGQPGKIPKRYLEGQLWKHGGNIFKRN